MIILRDGPCSDIANLDGFATERAQARDLGFEVKTLIHPSQIDACNDRDRGCDRGDGEGLTFAL